MTPIPFNKPYLTGKEQEYVQQAISQGPLAGDGPFTRRCNNWVEEKTRCKKSFLTHSCTAALEIAALLLDIQAGDEIIMPSYTFVSTANAFVLRGAIPVFVDIRQDTQNIDEDLIEAAITDRTRAIVVVHYAGVACEMNAINNIAQKHQLAVIEDAAQGVMSTYHGKALGSIGDIGAYSYHETKNIICGEGGSLLVNRDDLMQRAEIIREKGTDRSCFLRGEVDRYTWQEAGSSYLPGELIAAFLMAQLEQAEAITKTRMNSWNYYQQQLEALEKKGLLKRPVIPENCEHNAHGYYVVLDQQLKQEDVLKAFKTHNISVATHYVPLHYSPAGKKYGKTSGSMAVTENTANKLIRLPLWTGISTEQQDQVLDVFQSL